MAPQQQQQHHQQNSTFINDNSDTCPSLLNLPDSPILPLKHQHYRQNPDNTNNNRLIAERWMNAEVTTPTAAGSEQHKDSSRRPRHRSISLYGANSTRKQCHKELPIWLDDNELRYVSGVTYKTTCNDIIKALIDDELGIGNAHSSHINQQLPNDSNRKLAAELRDYNHYVITERWRGIERGYDGNMAILPVWRAWSRVHNELRLSLKQRQKINESTPTQFMELTRPALDSFSILKWLKRILYFGNKSKPKTNGKTCKKSAKTVNKIKDKCLPTKIKKERSDKLLRAIPPDQHYEDPQTNQNLKAELKPMIETKATRETLPNGNYIRRRRKDAPVRNSLRNKLAALHTEMNMRYNREYKLTRQLTAMYKHYTLQNKLYLCQEMELSVGRLQHNIEGFAIDIIKTERELLELRNEIKQHISLINNMKRMTIEQYWGTKPTTIKMGDCTVGVLTENSPDIHQDAKFPSETPLVNNIYELYDNNPSMLL